MFDLLKIEDFNFGNISIHEKSYENILFYNISYKTLTGGKPLRLLDFLMEICI